MADNIEHQDKGELVANCDRFNSLKHSTVRSYAFTEQGVAMLSTVLRSETAIRVSIRIMDAFVAMRRFMVTNAEVFQRLSTMEYHQLEMQQHLQETDKRIESVTESFLAIIHNNIVSPLYNKNNSNEKDINGHCGYFSHD
ncbi:ORF6N domain-containing protein [Segatella copri]|jgi:IS1 family transposase|uniref:ORF6N domain-containing protein n=1 Tax=Segatella copri TaxID=165179 RepID=UPI001D170F3E|nr:ORF6N domain-containing protein [Segatella copri]